MSETSEPGFDAPEATIPAPPEAPAPAPEVPLPPSNLAVGLTAGVGLGLLAALLYAGVAVIGEREFLMLGLLIGIAVAFGFHRFGHTRGVVPGVIAAVVTFLLYFLAIFVEGAGTIAKIAEVSFMEGLRTVVENAGEFLSAYFEDPLSYVFLIVSVGWAFWSAYDKKSFDKRNGR